MTAARVVLDCDPANGVDSANVDDSVALLALALDPATELVAVSTVAGNTTAHRSAVAAAELCAELRAAGLASPVVTTPAADGEGLRRALELAGPGATLVATGPLTNVAAVLTRHPTVINSLQSVVVMGGCLGYGDLVDLNFRVDPAAAEQVVLADLPLLLVPLDTTRQTLLSNARWSQMSETLRSAGVPCRLVESWCEWLEPWMRRATSERGIDGMWLHDLLAAVMVAHPDVARIRRYRLGFDPDIPGKLRQIPEAMPDAAQPTRTVDVVTDVCNDILVTILEAALLHAAEIGAR